MTPSRPDAEMADRDVQRVAVEPMDPHISSIQPGGGVCMRLELLWGVWRRRYLRLFRPAYVRRMAALRVGDPGGCPHELLDPRDLKFYRNVTDCHWPPEADPFRWRDRLPFARAGLAELLLLGGGCVVLALALAPVFWPAALVPAVLALFLLWFFRNPVRSIPAGEGTVVSPADGKVVAVEETEYDEFVGGSAITIGIFLSVFNVHVNRSPAAARSPPSSTPAVRGRATSWERWRTFFRRDTTYLRGTGSRHRVRRWWSCGRLSGWRDWWDFPRRREACS